LYQVLAEKGCPIWLKMYQLVHIPGRFDRIIEHGKPGISTGLALISGIDRKHDLSQAFPVPFIAGTVMAFYQRRYIGVLVAIIAF